MSTSKFFKWLMVLCFMLNVTFSHEVYAKNELDNDFVVVSLGDSYSSGEGIEPFYGQEKPIDEKINDFDWLSHRSQNSWPSMLIVNKKKLSDGKDNYWHFVATSGATTKNLSKSFKKEYNVEGNKGNISIPPQLDVFKKVNNVKYITITIGGNDVGFANIITECWKPNINTFSLNYVNDKIEQTKKDFEKNNGIKNDILNAYFDIIAAANNEANLLVGGYPKLLDLEGLHNVQEYMEKYPESSNGILKIVPFSKFISQDEAISINDGVSWFNNRIERIISLLQSEGYHIHFVSVEEEFDGHGAYSLNGPFIHPIITGYKGEDLKQGALDLTAYSVHPNINGAQAYAKCFQGLIDEIERREESNYSSTDLSSNPLATDNEINNSPINYKGVVIEPKDIILKFFDSIKSGQYETAVKCLDPTTEKSISFFGGLLSSLNSYLTGENISWGQLMLEKAGAIDVTLIECVTTDMEYDSNFDLANEWIPKIPLLNYALCTSADVKVKYRYKYRGEYYIIEEIYKVRRYGSKGWRISTLS